MSLARPEARGLFESLRYGVLGFLLTFCAGTWFFIIQPARSRRSHATNCSRLESVRDLVMDYRRGNGRYPEALSEAVPDGDLAMDVWGHPWIYESTPAGFILVSGGADGHSDGRDYWSERDRAELYQGMSRETCDDADSDALASELGVHACCGY